MALELLVTPVAAFPVALPGCPEACGSVTVPYPFGFRHGCFRAGFNLTCNETHHPPKLFLGDGMEVEDISLADGTMRVQSRVMNFSRSDGNATVKQSIDSTSLWDSGLNGTGMLVQLSVSKKHNVFVAIGFGFIAYLVSYPDTVDIGGTHEYVSACAVLCETGFPAPWDTSCSGLGCCRTAIAQGLGLPTYELQIKDLDSADCGTYDRPPSGRAFIVDREWFNGINIAAMQNDIFGGDSGPRTKVITKVPTVLLWGQRDLIVFDPHNGWRCMSLNSFAVTIFVAEIGGEIICKCSEGYEGNPYFAHGCQGTSTSLSTFHPLASIGRAYVDDNT
jgi:hypothetical protein